MKFLRSPFFSTRDAAHTSDTPQLEHDVQTNSLPRLPVEIWRRIIGFTIRLTGAATVGLEDPFQDYNLHEEYPEIDFTVFEDRRNLSLVCSSWYEAVSEISAEHIVVYSARQLKKLSKLFQSNRKYNGRRLGERTTRIDFKILGFYDHRDAVRLFRCSPNLLVYTNKNGPFDCPSRCTPLAVLKGLVTYCSQSLRRVEWNGPGEPPRFQDLVYLCNNLPHLTTLRLMSIHSYHLSDDTLPPIILPALKTLSLGIIPEPSEMKPDYAVTWDPFLKHLCVHPKQLPALERFECDLFPLLAMPFFDMHGYKLLSFRTSTNFADNLLADAVAACPNLHDLIVSHGPEVVSFPQYHPTLKRICIVPAIDVDVDVPPHIYEYAVMAPLDTMLMTVEDMKAPKLREVRVRNVGAYRDITIQPAWLSYWCRRWSHRAIVFCNKVGEVYQDPDCMSSTKPAFSSSTGTRARTLPPQDICYNIHLAT